MLVEVHGGYEEWSAAARNLLTRNVAPDAVTWHDERNPQLPIPEGTEHNVEPRAGSSIRVPRSFVAGARLVACHRDPKRWELLYRLLWRITHGDRHILEDPLDGDTRAFETMVAQVRRDEHKMHAFVRFRQIHDADGERYVAFHRPDHYIVALAAPFFVERFRPMRWSILTPDECAHWDGAALSFTPGVDGSTVESDGIEDVWRTYYAATFNPARVNERAMVRELPRRHWPTLPESQLIPTLLSEATTRVDRMLGHQSGTLSARPFVPGMDASLAQLAEAIACCRGCPLFEAATQPVFGEGPTDARLMLVGEQPGDEEDRLGKPFVGPAGEVLADAIVAAGLNRADVYVTNAVKHFTFRREGKRRIHERPRVSDVRACRPWLEAEIHQLSPEVIVCLGSTAAQSLLGPQVRIQRDRGRSVSSAWANHVIPTYHPSAVLRASDPQHSRDLFEWLVQDLRLAAERSRMATR